MHFVLKLYSLNKCSVYWNKNCKSETAVRYEVLVKKVVPIFKVSIEDLGENKQFTVNMCGWTGTWSFVPTQMNVKLGKHWTTAGTILNQANITATRAVQGMTTGHSAASDLGTCRHWSNLRVAFQLNLQSLKWDGSMIKNNDEWVKIWNEASILIWRYERSIRLEHTTKTSVM